MNNIQPYTDTEFKEHLLSGGLDNGANCLVCDKELHGHWTDYNGQIQCWVCGATYQISGSHLTEEGLIEMGITKEQVPARYADGHPFVPLWRVYWDETHSKLPFGWYMDGYPDRSEYDAFYRWVYRNIDRLDGYRGIFDFELIKEHFGGENG